MPQLRSSSTFNSVAWTCPDSSWTDPTIHHFVRRRGRSECKMDARSRNRNHFAIWRLFGAGDNEICNAVDNNCQFKIEGRRLGRNQRPLDAVNSRVAGFCFQFTASRCAVYGTTIHSCARWWRGCRIGCRSQHGLAVAFFLACSRACARAPLSSARSGHTNAARCAVGARRRKFFASGDLGRFSGVILDFCPKEKDAQGLPAWH